LGNFTVNRYSRLEVSSDRVRIRYVEDMAEIPTFQAMPDLDRNRDGVVDEAEKASYGAARMAVLAANLHLAVAGTALPLRVSSHDVALLSGQGGLSTLRLTAWLEAALPPSVNTSHAGPLALVYRDDNEPERIGWREIVLRPADSAVSVGDSTAPATDVSDELRAYPTDMLTAPLNRRAVSARLDLSGAASVASSPGGLIPTARAIGAPADPLTALLQQSASLGQIVASGRLGPSAILLAFLLACVWGAAHALSPGHGKTIVAAYLVGSRGTSWHALYLGLTVTATHTIGIYALGLVTLFAARFILPETLYPWLALASGFAVITIGIILLAGRLRQLRTGGTLGVHTHLADPRDHHDHFAWHAHQHDDLVHAHALGSGNAHDHHEFAHAHSHAHGHAHDDEHTHAHEQEHGHGHSHLPPGADGGPVTWRSLLALGVAGGLLPCPSALVLLLGAIAVGQVAFGLALVAAFSAGLALVLTGIGIALVYARRLAFGRAILRIEASGRLLRFAPVASALVISILGLGMTVEALGQTGLI
jgi:ABC-type nickel/cobalt efflux system permease component RcnA